MKNKFTLYIKIFLFIFFIFSNGYAKSNTNSPNNELEIFKAIDSKDYEKINNLLKNGVSPCLKREKKYETYTNVDFAFNHAIITGDIKIVKSFLPYIENITKPSCLYNPSLFYAIKNDDVKMIQFLIDSGADVNFPTKLYRKETPIQEALLERKIHSAQKLIDNGASIDKNIGFQSLELAIKNLNIKVVQFLIDNKYDVNFQNKDGNTILHLMAMGIVEKNLQSIETYIEKKEYIKRFPDTYVKAQEQVKRLKTNFKNYSKIAKLLLQNGADTKLKNNAGKTPLMIANENNTDTMLEVLKNAKQ
ncbi:ankyrin repeat domain-containing protein [Sulfurospirillum sp. 1612]|uniref:ankyrin repeat domain-containing protein n=1 Tax=Sulfurospirillum sp. 1612 TaxID=3094835 RepID=UPI002F921EE9